MISFDLQVKDFPFNAHSQAAVEAWHREAHEYGRNWPVVYFLHNDDTHEAYIGETLNAGRRMSQHWQNTDRQRLKVIHIMTDETFNKSVILDLEASLIKYVSADGKYTLQNSNNGLCDFNYFDRQEYAQNFRKVWDKLKALGLAQSSIADIENSDLYKYSPYKTLTEDQQKVLEKILYLINGFTQHGIEQSILVEGGAGTGKTILAVYLMKLLTDAERGVFDETDIPDVEDLSVLNALSNGKNQLKVGFVVPMQSLRRTLKKVFHTINGLSEEMILSPIEIAQRGPFDILVVDEAHRLHRRKALAHYPSFDAVNEMLGLPADATELDWVFKCSNVQVLFYDKTQSVRPSDIGKERFAAILGSHSVTRLSLTSQLRCLGGDDYIAYVRSVLNGKPTVPHGAFENYELRFYEDVDAMVRDINEKDKEYGLSCTVSGYAWRWVTKGLPAGTEVRDIQIGQGYLWNRTYTDWINSDRLPYEVGCIHTVQGYDLNYVGVIFGPEIVYDSISNRIIVDKDNYYDSLGKAVGEDTEALREYILNIYVTLMTRGIRGAYVYVCDPALREYLRPYFDVALVKQTSNILAMPFGDPSGTKQTAIKTGYHFGPSSLKKVAEKEPEDKKED